MLGNLLPTSNGVDTVMIRDFVLKSQIFFHNLIHYHDMRIYIHLLQLFEKSIDCYTSTHKDLGCIFHFN